MSTLELVLAIAAALWLCVFMPLMISRKRREFENDFMFRLVDDLAQDEEAADGGKEPQTG